MMLDVLNVNVCCLYVSNQMSLGAATLLGSGSWKTRCQLLLVGKDNTCVKTWLKMNKQINIGVKP